jgi:hypothetical protein
MEDETKSGSIIFPVKFPPIATFTRTKKNRLKGESPDIKTS